jgi:hypothetical protein
VKENLDFLKEFPKERDGSYIVYECFMFENLFRLLLKNGLDHEEALSFILANCSLSALVFQERIHNEAYQNISPEEALSPDLAAYREKLIYEMLEDVLGPRPSMQ